jgi:hypothetical protein
VNLDDMAKTGKRELKVILNITLVAPAGIEPASKL